MNDFTLNSFIVVPEMQMRAMAISAPKTDGLPVNTSEPSVRLTDSRNETGQAESSRARGASLRLYGTAGEVRKTWADMVKSTRPSREEKREYVCPTPPKQMRDILPSGVGGGKNDLDPMNRPGQKSNHDGKLLVNEPGGEGSIADLQLGTFCPVSHVNEPQVEKNDQLVPMNRPDRGGQISNSVVKLLVNHFLVTFNEEKDISHYDLEITKKENREVNIKNREDCVKIKKELLEQHAESFCNATIVHDGKRNIYSSKPLEPPEQSYTVSLVEGERRAAKLYTVTIKYTSSKDGKSLLNFLNVKNQDHVNFKEFQDFLQCLELVIREDPNKHRLLVGRSLYPDQNKYSGQHGNPAPAPDQLPDEYRNVQKAGAMEADGFYQSLRPTAQGLVLIVDLSMGTFYRSIPVIKYLKDGEIVDIEQRIQRPPLSDAERRWRKL